MRHDQEIDRRRLLALGSAGLAGWSLPAHAQPAPWPNRGLRFVVPFPAGGPVDTTGRAVAQKVGEMWGQPVVVDNRAGAGGIVGADIAAKLPGDGYNVFVCSIHHSVLPALKSPLPYDIERDFAPVTFGAIFPIVLVAHPSLPVKNVAELIALDKRTPGKLSFGSAGNGGGTHLAGELFNMKAGTTLQHVPYKGSAPAMTDLLGNQVQLMFSDAPTALPQLRAGKVKALAVGSVQRSALLPEVPTMAEEGLPDYEAYSWAAFVAPRGTPPEIVQKMSADMGRAMADPAVRQRLYDAGAEARPNTPAEFQRQLHGEIVKWAAVVKAGNIKMD
ncbi:tripartite tricarboxylate transporter substrate binding protein [Xylophilus sp. GOD-11R]|uniref:tripartite tricarboxylate transporter substrate binding protein n=1 Tax=Xylophilus sp. GOD-11R TaxID=3089814 RepID=UPI00298CAAC9|nr:tripartite tricarboxylate transporter substrate binding protein [Xylophilus sp. GOD-11R]WPB57339.1 tripartite tricarboxylate transporter substrate binding protein [Xylophilus sp. GOD-11R]